MSSPSQGVVTPSTTSNTNLVLETRSLLPRPWDDYLIDYYGTRWGKLPISQEELLVHEVTNYRLLRSSISGRDKFPIFLVHEMTHSTTKVLDLRMGHVPYFSRPWDGLFDYYGTRSPDGTYSLFSSSMRQPNRLLRYSISSLDMFPIFLVHETIYSTTTVLDLRMGHVPYFSRLWDGLFDYCGTRSSDGTSSLFPKKDLFVHETTTGRLLRTSSLPPRRNYHPQKTTTVLEQPLRFLQRNYSSTRRQYNRLLQYSKK